MHNEKLQEVLMLEHYFDFKCTGPDCIDNCCHTWRINIDTETYNKYKNLKDSQLKNNLMSSIIKKDEDFLINLSQENKTCPLLDKSTLCSVHKELGEVFLSNTCKTYPRRKYLYFDKIQYSLSLSCPEVTKSYLFLKSGILFRNTKVNLQIENALTYDPYKEICSNIRSCAINIVNDTRYPFHKKLFYFGIAMDGLNRLLEESHINSLVLDKVTSYINYMDNYDSIMNINTQTVGNTIKIATYYKIANLLPHIININNKSPFNSEFFNRLNNLQNKEVSENVFEHKKRLIDKYIEEKPYVFSNYLVFSMFTNNFLTSIDNFETQFKSIIIRFIFVELFISIIYYDKDKLEDADIINAIYYISRSFDHSSAEDIFISFCNENKDARLSLYLACI